MWCPLETGQVYFWWKGYQKS